MYDVIACETCSSLDEKITENLLYSFIEIRVETFSNFEHDSGKYANRRNEVNIVGIPIIGINCIAPLRV